MIKLVCQPEPSNFDKNVRQKAIHYFSIHSYPKTAIGWKGKDYWTLALNDLYEAYGGICCYCAEWISHSTGSPTVDHFIPKSIAPDLAYEWSNFRLASLKYNRAKSNYTDILDPFEIEPGWFVLHFPSLQVLANRQLPTEVQQKIEITIEKLGLRDEVSIKSRYRWLKKYNEYNNPFQFLKDNAPFIAYEIGRQGILNDLPKIMSLI